MRKTMRLPPDVKLPDDLSPFGRVKEVTKRLLAVPREEVERRLKDEESRAQRKPARKDPPVPLNGG